MSALCKQSDRCSELHTWLIVVLGLTLLIQTNVVGDNTPNTALVTIRVFVPNDLRASETGVNFDSSFLCLLTQPCRNARKRHNVIAFVVHLRRMRHRDRSRLSQEYHLVV